MADTFISYAREDREFVGRLAAALEAAGCSLWWDRDLAGGAEFSADIERELKAAKAVIVVWSAHGVKSHWVKDEAAIARDKGTLVPLSLDDTEAPIGFRQFHAINFATWKGEAGAAPFVSLKGSIAAKAGAAPAAAALAPRPKALTSRKLFLAGAAVIAAVLLGAAAWLLLRPGDRPAVATNSPAADAGVAVPSIPEASLAVLPFENLSTDKANAFFATGIQDEILTRLTKIGSLKVISRTSTAHLASRPDNLPEIAKQLGVANVLEGSVQREGNAVRVNVQLIKAATDAHLWAEIYDRKLDDIFAVQSEIAIAIAEALSAKVTGSEKQALAVAPTKNTAAYDAYLRGLAFYRKSEILNAERLLQQAVKLDPSFADAWALLARAHARLFHEGDRADARRAAARAAIDTALRLQPDLAEVLLAQAYHQYWVERDFTGARRRFELVYAKWPNNGDAAAALGYIARRQGRWDEAKAYLKQAVALDPLSQVSRFDEAATLVYTREFSAAQSRLDEALNIWPDNLGLIGFKARVHQALGQLDQAEELLEGLRPKPEDFFALDAIFYQAVYRRRYADAISTIEDSLALDQAVGSPGITSSQLNLYLGDMRRLSGDAAGAKANYMLVRDELLPEVKKQPENALLLSMMAIMYCGLGEREEAIEYAERVVKLVPVAKDALDGAAWEETRARIWARFGDRDRAIPAIARLRKLPGSVLTPAILRLDPDFDNLRGDPRFEALLVEPN